MKYIFIFSVYLLSSVTYCNAQQNLRLWYKQPASSGKNLQEAVPLGNGHLGAMPDGNVFDETILLNDITLWSGSKQNANRPGAASHLDQIRDAIFAGKYSVAEGLVNHFFVCSGVGTSFGSSKNAPYGSYQLLGKLHIDYSYEKNQPDITPTNYVRALSLDSAIATTTYKIDGVTYHREYFTSFADDVILIRITADKPGKVNFNLAISRSENAISSLINDNELQLKGQLNDGYNGNNGVKFLTKIKIINDGGTIVTGSNNLGVKNADAATIYISEASDFFEKETTSFYKPGFNYIDYAVTQLDQAMSKPYRKEKKAHIAAYQKMFERATLSLGNKNTTHAALPTNQRVLQYAKDKTDTGLPVLYFQFGRYLLISSTKPGWLPPNLQGLWANSTQPPWNADYHLNINLQMNYWPLNVTNLPMLNEPFYKLVKGLVKPGERTAKVYYDVNKGWIAHSITNVWGYTAPGEAASWGSANSGSGWMANMLWLHYAFSQNKAYLKKLYPIIKGSAQFYLHALVEDPNNGYLVTAPSSSPENAFKYKAPDGSMKTASVCAGPTIDNQIIRALFTHVIKAANMLHLDPQFAAVLDSVRKRLPPNQIDANGRLMEWLQPFQLTNAHHRHMSPVWGVYPGTEISFAKNPNIAAAAKKLIIDRGYGSSFGWSDAWKISLWARMREGNTAFQFLNYLLNPSSNGGHAFPNLFDYYGGNGIFQIDANFGGTAGIAEMLIQSQAGQIELLPALPNAWPDGHFEGLAVHGGGIVNATWRNGKLTSATLKSTSNHTYTIEIPDGLKTQTEHSKIQYSKDGKTLTVTLKKGERIRLKFMTSYS